LSETLGKSLYPEHGKVLSETLGKSLYPEHGKMILRNFQKDCLDAVTVNAEAGVQRQLAVIATGGGKTTIFAELTNRRLQYGRVLIVAHRKELLKQAAKAVMDACPGKLVSIERAGDRANPRSDVVIASIATVGRKGSERIKRFADGFATIIVDEAHHSIAEQYQSLFEQLGFRRDKNLRSDPPGALLIGWTATPQRSDGVGLEAVYDEITYVKTIRDLILEGWLVDLASYRIKSAVNLDGVGMQAGDFKEGELSRAVNIGARNELIVKAYINHVPGKKTIVFCVDVQHVKDVVELFVYAGIKAEAIIGATPDGVRDAIIERFRAGATRVLVNCMVATEGFDVPDVECVIMGAPTNSQNKVIQQAGRASRVSCGLDGLDTVAERLAAIAASAKPFATIIDIVDNCKRHSIVMLATLFGLDKEINLRGRHMMEAVKEIEEAAAINPNIRVNHVRDLDNLKALETVSVKVDLWAGLEVPANVKKYSEFNFKEHEDVDSFKLLIDKHESLIIRQNMLGKWEAINETSATVDTTTGEIVAHPTTHTVLGHADTMEDAFARSDKWISDNFEDRVTLLKRNAAAWRELDPTPLQIPYLVSKYHAYRTQNGGGLFVNLGGTPTKVTRGLANDLLGNLFSKKRAKQRA
jgi:superfamily II DNA or RNA helicase